MTDLATLRARCEAAGWTMDEGKTFSWIMYNCEADSCWEFRFEAVPDDIAAAHALIDWWERRDWVACPRCRDLNLENYCKVCDGKGEVPPGVVGDG